MTCQLCNQIDCAGPRKEGPYCCQYAAARRARPKPPRSEVVFKAIRRKGGSMQLSPVRTGIPVRGNGHASKAGKGR